jgi:mRNA interferase RelE/StbE
VSALNRDPLTGKARRFILAASPRRVGKPLKLGLEGLHSARRVIYRVIYRVDDDRRLVTVIAIEHRSDVYRPQ